jgi:rod shape-determining protein MreC
VRIRAKFKQPLLLVGAISFPLIVGAASPDIIQQVRSLTTSVTSPVLELQDRATRVVKHGVSTLAEWPSLRRQNQSLESELSALKAKLSGFDEMTREMERLHSLLKIKGTFKQKSVATRVIQRDPSHWSQYVVINKGVKDGVIEDTVLVHPDGLAGKVTSAGPYSARAILLTDRQSRVSAMNDRTRDVGLIEGTGTGLLKMTYLDRDSKIEVGDKIISSGLGGIYPKGVHVGVVQMIGSAEDSLSLYAVVKPAAPFSKLEELLCISLQIEN